ncbi:hypothetical protein GF322_05250 [Candidatus Dependentiae bacterium]|nr:hypothetical protein [Candidatus Dependentiae bacterium]
MYLSSTFLKKSILIFIFYCCVSGVLYSVETNKTDLNEKKEEETRIRTNDMRSFPYHINKAEELREERKHRQDLQDDKVRMLQGITEINNGINRLKNELQNRNLSDEEKIQKENELSNKYEELKYKKRELDRIEAYLIDDSWGKIFFNVFAKDSKDLLQQTHFKTALEGLYKGIVYKSLTPVEKALGATLENYVNRFFSGTFGTLERLISWIYRQIFCNGSHAFSIEEVGYWKQLVIRDLYEIEIMIRNVEKIDSRGRAEILREYDNAEDNKQEINLWSDFIEDLALTYEELASEIDSRKDYYGNKKDGYGIFNCVQRLKNKLLKVKNLFLKVKTVKELANLPESKSIMTAIRKSFETYFDNLINLITPVDIKSGPSRIPPTGINHGGDRWNNYGSSGGMYPHSRAIEY